MRMFMLIVVAALSAGSAAAEALTGEFGVWSYVHFQETETSELVLIAETEGESGRLTFMCARSYERNPVLLFHSKSFLGPQVRFKVREAAYRTNTTPHRDVAWLQDGSNAIMEGQPADEALRDLMFSQTALFLVQNSMERTVPHLFELEGGRWALLNFASECERLLR